MKTRLFTCLALFCAPAILAEPKIRIAPPGSKTNVVTSVNFAEHDRPLQDRNKYAFDLKRKDDYDVDQAAKHLYFGWRYVDIPGKTHVFGKLEVSGRSEAGKFRVHGKPVPLSLKELATPERADEPDFLVFVHGFNNSFDSALIQTAQLGYDLQQIGEFPIQMWSYRWKSRGMLSAYYEDRDHLREYSRGLGAFIRQIVDLRPSGSVHFVVHSMGNEVFLQAMNLIQKDPVFDKKILGKVMLFALDVRESDFKKWVPTVVARSAQVTHYFSSLDTAMFASRIANFAKIEKRAGAHFVPVVGVQSFDVDSINHRWDRLGHGYFAAKEPLIREIRTLIQDPACLLGPEDRNGSQVEKVSSPEGVYWRYR